MQSSKIVMCARHTEAKSPHRFPQRSICDEICFLSLIPYFIRSPVTYPPGSPSVLQTLFLIFPSSPSPSYLSPTVCPQDHGHATSSSSPWSRKYNNSCLIPPVNTVTILVICLIIPLCHCCILVRNAGTRFTVITCCSVKDTLINWNLIGTANDTDSMDPWGKVNRTCGQWV